VRAVPDRIFTPMGLFRPLLFSLLCWCASLCVAQQVAGAPEGSGPLTLAAPMQWQVLPEGTVSGPLEFSDPAKADGFKDLVSGTTLPTADGQAVWLRFALPPTATAQTWYLRIPRLRISKVTLYFLDEQSRWDSQSAGLDVAVNQWPLPTRLPSFQLATRTDRSQTYFLKLQHRSPIAEHPELVTPIDYIVAANQTGGLVGLMLGLFGLLTLLSLLTARLYRNVHFAWFALFVASLLLMQLVLIGFAGQHIWPSSVYLNQVMFWVSSLWSLAACLWFILQVSYAKQAFVRLYRISLGVIALVLVCSAAVAIMGQTFPRGGLTLLTAPAIAWALGCLLWMARSQPWLWVVAAGFAPLALALSTRLAYHFGWVAHIEVTQFWSVLVGIVGMMVIYAGLILCNRDTFAAVQREAALSHTDLATGLSAAHIATMRLPRAMARSARSGEACGVVMLQWTDFKKQVDPLPDAQKNLVLSQFGSRLRRLSRYIDTVARLDDDHFLLIVESPVSRNNLNALGTKILASCLRPVDQLKTGASFQVHIALWISADKPWIAEAVLEALRSRLKQMEQGTQRKVQFTDSPLSSPVNDAAVLKPPQTSMGQSSHAQAMLAKINAIEADPIVPRLSKGR
jgi:two-component system, sensor histidine kinase LadS